MVKFRGHRAIDNSHGVIQRLVRKNARLEAFGRRIAIKVVGGVCGLVPEAGAFICNAVFVPVEAIAIFVVQSTVTGIIEGTIHKVWALGVDGLEYLIIDGRDPQDAGPFFHALRLLDKNDIRAAAERDLPSGFTEAFENYNTALESVLTRWEQERAASP